VKAPLALHGLPWGLRVNLHVAREQRSVAISDKAIPSLRAKETNVAEERFVRRILRRSRHEASSIG